MIDPFQRVIGLNRGDFHADAVLFTQQHIDHKDMGAVTNGATIIEAPGHYSVKDVRILGVHAFHDDQEGLLAGEVTMFGISIDGYRIVHLSDIGEALDDERLKMLGHPDILLFPAGEHTTLTLEEVRELIARWKPNIAVPMGYHLPGLVMPMASREKVERYFPNFRESRLIELAPSQKLAPGTEIRILDQIAQS